MGATAARNRFLSFRSRRRSSNGNGNNSNTNNTNNMEIRNSNDTTTTTKEIDNSDDFSSKSLSQQATNITTTELHHGIGNMKNEIENSAAAAAAAAAVTAIGIAVTDVDPVVAVIPPNNKNENRKNLMVNIAEYADCDDI